MINVSNSFKRQLYNDRRNYLEYVDITLKDGTELNLTNEHLWNGGLTIDDAVSNDNSFDVGSAIINKCKVNINNIYDDFSEYDFTDAKVVAYVGLGLPDNTTERVRKGTFEIDETQYNGSIITLSCLDNMRKFDKPYTASRLTYPATLNSIVRDACDCCGVILQTYNFPHDSFVVQERPLDKAITFREIISWAAQIACCFCRCDVYGRLELKWYDQDALERADLDGGYFDRDNEDVYRSGDDADGGSFNPWNNGYEYDGGSFTDLRDVHHIYSNYSSSISMDDVVITGVRVLEKTKEDDQDAIVTYQSGRDGYVVSIENNELIKGGVGEAISGWIGERLIGFRFRKATISHSSDPTIEAGDVGFWTDRKQNTFRIVISSTKFSTGGSQTTISSAENPARNSAARYSAQTKNYVDYRKYIERERTDREKALDELKDRADNSPGLFTTTVQQADGSDIFYMHNKPSLEESDIVWKMTAEAWAVSTDGGKTYNGGMTVDGDAIVRILTAVGLNADWIKTGQIKVTKGDKTVFFVDIDTGEVRITPDYFELSGKTVEQIAQEKADKKISDFVNSVYDPKIASIQSQIDGQIETWYYDYEPTLNNVPASDWKAEADRVKHEGDLFYWKSKGYSYRFLKDGSIWKWQLITDSDITKALSEAAKAQDTADSKRRVFTSTPSPPYDKGDLWTQGATGDILTCITSRSSGNYVSTDWQKRNKYTDDTAVDILDKKLDSTEEIFNRLTQDGKVQGIYLQNGNLYVNASFIKSGTLALGGANNVNGKLSIRNAANTEIGRWDKDGIYVDGGSIYCKTSTTGVSIYGGRMHLTHGDTDVGYIGTNSMNGYPSYKGLVFDLESTGAYMTWAAKASASENLYAARLLYANKTFSSYIAGKLYAACDMDFRNYKIQNAYIDGVRVQSSFNIPNNVDCDIYSNVDFHNYEIQNAYINALRVRTSFSIPNNVDCDFYSHVNFNNYEIQNAKLNNLVAINGYTPYEGRIYFIAQIESNSGGGITWKRCSATLKDGIVISVSVDAQS